MLIVTHIAGFLLGPLTAPVNRVHGLKLRAAESVRIGIPWLAGCVVIDAIAVVLGPLAVGAYLHYTHWIW